MHRATRVVIAMGCTVASACTHDFGRYRYAADASVPDSGANGGATGLVGAAAGAMATGGVSGGAGGAGASGDGADADPPIAP